MTCAGHGMTLRDLRLTTVFWNSLDLRKHLKAHMWKWVTHLCSRIVISQDAPQDQTWADCSMSPRTRLTKPSLTCAFIFKHACGFRSLNVWLVIPGHVLGSRTRRYPYVGILGMKQDSTSHQYYSQVKRAYIRERVGEEVCHSFLSRA